MPTQRLKIHLNIARWRRLERPSHKLTKILDLGLPKLVILKKQINVISHQTAPDRTRIIEIVEKHSRQKMEECVCNANRAFNSYSEVHQEIIC